MTRAPDWSASLTPGHWVRISGDNPEAGLPPTPAGTRYLADNDPAQDPTLNPPRSLKERIRRLAGREWLAPWSGRVGLSAITEAWNGAAFASRVGRAGAMIVFGGGHNNYFGSDVHAFDLARRQWRRLTTGFVAGTPSQYGDGAVYPQSTYPDGSPLPPHTYNYVQYDAMEGQFMLLKGQTQLGPNVVATPIPHLFNLATLTWRAGPRHPSAILNSGGCSTWDARRRLLWGHSGDDGGGNAFVAFSPDGGAGQWREFHPNKLPGVANHNAMQIHPETDAIAVAVHAWDSLARIDPAAPERPIARVASRGRKPRLQPCAALEYSPGLGRLVYCSAANRAAVYAIDWGAVASWSLLSAAGGRDPVADAAAHSRHDVQRNHTFGRFRVAHFDQFDLAILVRHVDSPVYVMRLEADQRVGERRAR